MKELWLLQPRFEQRGGQRPVRLLSQPRFRAAYDFLLLRCESGEVDSQLGLWWDEFQDAADDRRAEMLLPDDVAKKRRRRKKPSATPQVELPIGQSLTSDAFAETVVIDDALH